MAEVIIQESEDREVTAAEISCGVLFEWSNTPFMKLSVPSTMQTANEEPMVRAVSLRTGLITNIRPEQVVLVYPPSTVLALHNERQD